MLYQGAIPSLGARRRLPSLCRVGTAMALLLLTARPSALAQAGSAAAPDAVRVTTIYVVRHSEKMTPPDPNALQPPTLALSEAGRARSARLATMLKTVELAAAYATNTTRAQDTARPAAEQAGIPVSAYEANTPKPFVEQVMKEHAGKSVLVIGHTNTIGPTLNAFGAPGKMVIADNDYSNIFVLSVVECGGQRSAHLQRLRFPE